MSNQNTPKDVAPIVYACHIPKDDLLTVAVDLPESYTKWEKVGGTKMSGWEREVEMTFRFDFTGVPLEHVFELAVGALVIDARPALKKEGFLFCEQNPVVNVNVAERKKRGPAQPRNLAAQLKRGAELGTLAQDLKSVDKTTLEAYLKAAQELLNAA
jgi:hypothetical protein